MKRSARL